MTSVKCKAIVRPAFRGRRLPFHGVYCCLIGNSLKSVTEKETFVFVATDPVYATVLHNRRETTIKETRSVAPYWHLILAIGPFPVSGIALSCAQRWVNCTRGCNSKIRYGIKLSKEYGVPCYSCDIPPSGGTLRFLEKYAPPTYARTYRRFLEQTPFTTPLKTPQKTPFATPHKSPRKRNNVWT